MSGEIELVSDGESLAVIGAAADVERFLAHGGLGEAASKDLDLGRLCSASGAAGAAVQLGADLAANSGRWVKLTAESAEAVRRYGLMATKTPGVSHAMIGQPGNVLQWVQITQAPTLLLGGPFALTALATMMQQRAMQQQMDRMVEYLQRIDEKVDDILQAQTDAVVADMVGVGQVIEDALAVRDAVGSVSELAWSKVQGTAQTIASTQAYALGRLDAIAAKLQKKADLGDIGRATSKAAPQVREWLAVLARTFQIEDGLHLLELERLFDSSPDTLEAHRQGLATIRRNRVDLVGSRTASLLAQMDETVKRANQKVLFNPRDAPAAVRSSNQVSAEVLSLRGLLGIDDAHGAAEAKRWGQAAGEVVAKVRVGTAERASAAYRFGEQGLDRVTGPFRPMDLDGDGVPDRPRAAAALEQAGAAIKGSAQTVAAALGGRFRRNRDAPTPIAGAEPDARDQPDS